MFEVGQRVHIKSAAEILRMVTREGLDGWRMNEFFFNRTMLQYCGGYAVVGTVSSNGNCMLRDFVGLPTTGQPERWVWSMELLEPVFKLGDRVRIKPLEEVRRVPAWVTSMNPLSGRYATISGVNGNLIELKDWSDPSGTNWSFNKGMVDPIMPISVGVDFGGAISKAKHFGSGFFGTLRDGCKEVMDYLSKKGVSFYLIPDPTDQNKARIEKERCRAAKLPICIEDMDRSRLRWYIEGGPEVDWQLIKAFFESEIKKQRGE